MDPSGDNIFAKTLDNALGIFRLAGGQGRNRGNRGIIDAGKGFVFSANRRNI